MITCLFSSQVFRLRRSTLEELYKIIPEVPLLYLKSDLDGEIVDFKLMLLCDETYSSWGKRLVYFTCGRNVI